MAESQLSYQMIRSANQAREADEIKTDQRKKNLLILMLNYLSEEGYIESANSLSKETSIDVGKYEVCDNIDLETILMEYESYYFVKFSKYPKIVKKTSQNGDEKTTRIGKMKNTRSSSTPSLPRIPNRPASPTNNVRPKSGFQGRSAQKRTAVSSKERPSPQNGSAKPPTSNHMLNGDGLQGLAIAGSSSATDQSHAQANGHDQPKQKQKFGQIIDIRSMINDATRMNAEEGASDLGDRLLKPLGGYMGYNNEWRELAQVISRDIYSEDPNVRWEDIIGLDNAKRLVKEAVVYPIKYPQLFKGILSPWKGLLLYGPPGTGKTLLAKAVATECNTTFFNISASSIVSKWRGDSEKLVRVLFELARFHAPSTIFIDELESIMSQRGSAGAGGEHEGSRRMKTELLVQMDGLSKTDDLVFLLAASNLPWELDHAMLRRLEKRIIVDLPTPEARKSMFKFYLPPVVVPKDGGLSLKAEIDYDHVADATEGYTGSDIKLVCKEAAMRPVRKIFDALENHHTNEEICVELSPIKTIDIELALQHTKPSAQRLSAKYTAWQKEFESV
ncbi:katanin p60 ATPase-containing subunit A-like 2 isoform X2 [Lineus longissimus]|uniref:katanin p60 ATPase-containing subunit A-like 2 isoform X2 n=1 Tax=Lineus longissimus TaxID=88925 RepID=UPI002B4E1489